MSKWIEEAETTLHAAMTVFDGEETIEESRALALIAIAHELKSIGTNLEELKRIKSELLSLREVLDRD